MKRDGNKMRISAGAGLIILGAAGFALPLGHPTPWQNGFLILIGAALIAQAFYFRRKPRA